MRPAVLSPALLKRAFATAATTSKTPVQSFTGAIGSTPLIRIPSLSNELGCNIYGKAEFQNPGGSVKDRAALYVVKDAEERGQSVLKVCVRACGR